MSSCVCVILNTFLGNKETVNPALIAYAAKVNATLSLAVIYFKPFSVCLYTLAQIYLDTLSNPVHPRSNKYYSRLNFFFVMKSEWRGSNPQLSAWKADTLPVELHSQKKQQDCYLFTATKLGSFQY